MQNKCEHHHNKMIHKSTDDAVFTWESLLDLYTTYANLSPANKFAPAISPPIRMAGNPGTFRPVMVIQAMHGNCRSPWQLLWNLETRRLHNGLQISQDYSCAIRTINANKQSGWTAVCQQGRYVQVCVLCHHPYIFVTTKQRQATGGIIATCVEAALTFSCPNKLAVV